MMTVVLSSTGSSWAHCRSLPAGRLFCTLAFNRGRPSRSARSAMHITYARKGISELLSLRDQPKSRGGRILLKPHTVSPRLDVPSHIQVPLYVKTGKNPWLEELQIQDNEGIDRMRKAGKLAADVLEMAGTLVKPGITTDEIDKAVHQMIVDNGAYPSPLMYGGFPKSVCTSVNECVCHGIPDSRPLQDGDILNIDVTVYLHGYHGDTSRMFYVGDVSTKAKLLCETTLACLEAAIKICGPGVPIKQIGKVIHDMADKAKFGVIQDFVGHGVGAQFHSLPIVQHSRNYDQTQMVEGMTFTIEPMLTEGTIRNRMWSDKWTVVTADGKLSAQYEHTILITRDGHEVLTVWPQKR